jgi:DNA polymerase elongation subunit (family B)
MEAKELETLYQERRLIKELIRLDRSRYNYLEARSQEIKIKINSEYAPVATGFFMMYDAMLAQRITMMGIENLKELLEEHK